jgi:hypothetical protein
MKTPLKSSFLSGLTMNSILTITALLFTWSCETQNVNPVEDENAVFLDFSINEQTVLPTSINRIGKEVRLEVGHDANLSALAPMFNIPEGYSVYANGVKQINGTSYLDFSQPVSYEIKGDNSTSTEWNVAVVPLKCKILVDASHDGGVWWYPQYEATGFDADKPHQGQAFANTLRAKGFEVTELGRGVELKEEMFFGHYIVIRAGGFETYTNRELEVYTNLIDRGMNLVFFTDHKKFDAKDELGDHLGLKFKGSANGTITNLSPHQITSEITSLDYIAGSVLDNVNENPNIEILGWLGSEDYADLNFNGVEDMDEPVASPVMGILNYPHSRIFFIGDMNGIEVQPQPFIDNLLSWMGDCSNW